MLHPFCPQGQRLLQLVRVPPLLLIREGSLDICQGVGAAMCALKLDAKYTERRKRVTRGGAGIKVVLLTTRPGLTRAAICATCKQQRLLLSQAPGRGGSGTLSG